MNKRTVGLQRRTSACSMFSDTAMTKATDDILAAVHVRREAVFKCGAYENMLKFAGRTFV